MLALFVLPAASFTQTYQVFAVADISYDLLVNVPVVVQLLGAVELLVIAYPVTPTPSDAVQLNVL